MGNVPMGEGFDYKSGYYQHVCDLASGGMGSVTVELRRDGSFERLYAVKRLHPHLRADGDFRDMFMDEARIAGMIHHPNVVGVLDVGEDSSGPFLVMDYVDSVPLSSVLSTASRRSEQLPLDLCVHVARDVARGLAAAHELEGRDGESLSVIHRDVSPSNVLVGYDGVSRLTDFGIARALGRTTRTATGMIKGKFAYLSPEQLRFEEPDQRSDLFSLGVTLYEMLSGKRLYRGNDGARRILSEPPPDIADERPEASSALVSLLFDLLAKKPELRPKSAREVERRLTEILDAFDPTERVDVGAYVSELTGPARAQRAAQLREGMESVGKSPARLASAQRVIRPVAIAVASVCLTLAGAFAWVTVFGDPDPTEANHGAPPPAAETALAGAPPSIAREGAGEDGEADGEMRGEMDGEEATAQTEAPAESTMVATAADAESTPARSGRTTRPRRRPSAMMSMARDGAEPSQQSGLQLRGWEGQ
jgi:serine/threonine-protein kinase